MKTKTLLTAAFLAVSLLPSCVREELAISPGHGEEIDISLALQMGDILVSKAIGDEERPYTYAKPEELHISHCVVAVFKLNNGMPGDLLDCKEVLAPGLGSTTVNDTLAYRVSGIRAKTGDVRVLVIANSALDYSTMKNYADFKRAIEQTSFTPAFNPEALVKVGYKDLTLTMAHGKTDIVVPLMQLAARVDLDFVAPKTPGGKNKWGIRIKSVRIQNIQSQTFVILESVNPLALKPLIPSWTKAINQTVTDKYKLTFYTYEKKWYADSRDPEALRVDVDIDYVKIDTQTSVQSKSYQLWINPHTSMPGCTTDGLLHGRLYMGEATFSAPTIEVEPVLWYKVVGWGIQSDIIIPDF